MANLKPGRGLRAGNYNNALENEARRIARLGVVDAQEAVSIAITLRDMAILQEIADRAGETRKEQRKEYRRQQMQFRAEQKARMRRLEALWATDSFMARHVAPKQGTPESFQAFRAELARIAGNASQADKDFYRPRHVARALRLRTTHNTSTCAYSV